jgi:hypothetical protein
MFYEDEHGNVYLKARYGVALMLVSIALVAFIDGLPV